MRLRLKRKSRRTNPILPNLECKTDRNLCPAEFEGTGEFKAILSLPSSPVIAEEHSHAIRSNRVCETSSALAYSRRRGAQSVLVTAFLFLAQPPYKPGFTVGCTLRHSSGLSPIVFVHWSVKCFLKTQKMVSNLLTFIPLQHLKEIQAPIEPFKLSRAFGSGVFGL